MRGEELTRKLYPVMLGFTSSAPTYGSPGYACYETLTLFYFGQAKCFSYL
jgi:hypothetical protein